MCKWDEGLFMYSVVGRGFLIGEESKNIAFFFNFFFTKQCFTLFAEHRLKVLDVDALVSEAVQAHENGETMTVQV